MSSLSVLCMTCDPGPQIQAVLAPLRALAGEIVVAADDAVSAQDLGLYAAVADRIVRYPFARPVERPLAWAHGLCRGDWILRIDGDEVPSAALVEALAEAIDRADRSQFWIRRAWLYPDAEHAIEQRPWSPDFQLRLVRNDPALLSFEGAMHTTARPVWGAGFIEAPMYHLDLLLKSYAQRQAKVADYESLRPGLRSPGGGPMEVYYLPEDWVQRPGSAVPHVDQPGILAALRDEPLLPAVAVALADLVVATRSDIDAVWDSRPLADGDYRGEIEVVDPDLQLTPGHPDEVIVRVRNTGAATWPGGEGLPAIRVGYRWLTPGGDAVVPDAGRGLFPCRVAPGEQVHVRLPVTAPLDAPSELLLELDLLQEHVRWFGTPTRATVLARPRSAIRPR